MPKCPDCPSDANGAGSHQPPWSVDWWVCSNGHVVLVSPPGETERNRQQPWHPASRGWVG